MWAFAFIEKLKGIDTVELAQIILPTETEFSVK